MKTPEQWLEIIHGRGAMTQPAGTLRIIQQIQDDVIDDVIEALKSAAGHRTLIDRSDLSALDRIEEIAKGALDRIAK